MRRKILSGVVIGISSVLLISSLVGIGFIWCYKQPFKSEVNTRLSIIDRELAQAQTALRNAQEELDRAQRIVEAAEEALESLSEQTNQARKFMQTVTDVLDNTITPNLEASKEKIDQAQKSLEDLHSSIEVVNKLPFVNLRIPDIDLLSSFIDITDSIQTEITRVGDIAKKASMFLSDSSYLLGGDLKETKDNILELQLVVTEYEGKIVIWRDQIATIKTEFPGWVNRASVIMTIFLLWFGFSQFGLLFHGLNAWHGGDVLVGLRRK